MAAVYEYLQSVALGAGGGPNHGRLSIYRSERSYGSFVRNIELPETEDAKEKETKLRVE